MLSDHQIERYARQIVVPEIGGRGQERLLSATVAIHGGGDAASVCATYLAGAGVGTVGFTGSRAAGSLGAVLDVAERNPDCRLIDGPVSSPDVAIAIGRTIPAVFDPGSIVFWGGATTGKASRAHYPPGVVCTTCLAGMARRGDRDEGAEHILGTLLALEALRALLGFELPREPTLFQLDLLRGGATIEPLHPQADCPRH